MSSWLLIRTLRQQPAVSTEELYDLATDPKAQQNVLKSQPDVGQRLGLGLTTLGTQRPTLNEEAVTIPVDQAHIEKLRSLGYVR